MNQLEHVTPEQEALVLKMTDESCQTSRIVSATGLKRQEVLKIAEQANHEWLAKNWHFKWPVKRPPKKKSRYRKVHVGEKSNFRTPYRPDGIWR